MAQALVTVVEVEPFPATAATAGLDDEARQAIAVHVAQHPLDGVLIPGTGALRKLRWGGTTGGKRGGYRVVYYFFSMDFPLYLLAVPLGRLRQEPANRPDASPAGEIVQVVGGAEIGREGCGPTKEDVVSKIGKDLIHGMENAVAHATGRAGAARETVVGVSIPDRIDVAGVRMKLGLSQEAFALRFGFSVKNIRNWEQGIRQPEGSARAYLLVIDRAPKAVERALNAA